MTSAIRLIGMQKTGPFDRLMRTAGRLAAILQSIQHELLDKSGDSGDGQHQQQRERCRHVPIQGREAARTPYAGAPMAA